METMVLLFPGFERQTKHKTNQTTHAATLQTTDTARKTVRQQWHEEKPNKNRGAAMATHARERQSSQSLLPQTLLNKMTPKQKP